MVRETLSGTPTTSPAPAGIDLGALLPALGACALALSFGWLDPAGNGPAAGVLIAAAGLDGLGRIVWRITLRRSPDLAGTPSIVLPSIVLASERGTAVSAVLTAAAAMAWPDGFSILAGLLAGLLAMGGIARLVVAWIVLTTGQEPEND